MDQILDLENRVRTIENRASLGTGPSQRFRNFEYEPAIPMAENVQLLASLQSAGSTTAIVGWITPDNPDLETFEIWVKDLTSAAGGTVKMFEARESPATLVLTSDANTAKTIYVRPRMRSGVGAELDACPTVTAEIFVPDPTPAPNSITNTMLQRSGADPISIGTADIQNASITNAKIVDLQASKITAGTLQAGVIYAGAIQAVQIQAGTVTAVNMSGGTFSLVSGAQQWRVNATDGMYQHDTSANQRIQIKQGRLESRVHSTGALKALIDQTGFTFFNTAGTTQEVRLASNASNQGFLSLNQGGNLRVTLSADGGSSSLQANSGVLGLNNSSSVRRVNLGTDTSDRGVLGLTAGGGVGVVIQAGNSSTAGLYINGTKIVGVQEADPGAGITLANIRAILLAHGLIG